MSVEKVKGGYENVGAAGSHGKFSTKAGAERQKAAMFANGYHKANGGEVSDEELHRRILEHLLKKRTEGSDKDLLEAIRGKPSEESALPTKEADEPVAEASDQEVPPGTDEDDEDEDTKTLLHLLAHSED